MSAPHHPRALRRASAEITDPGVIDDVFRGAKLLFLALADQPAPYVLPVCFGFEDGVLYVHGAKEGAKMDLLRANPSVGFSASTDMNVVPGASACDFTCTGQSVVGTGTARILESEDERARGLDAIMRHYSSAPAEGSYAPGPLSRTCVIAICIDTFRAKRVG